MGKVSEGDQRSVRRGIRSVLLRRKEGKRGDEGRDRKERRGKEGLGKRSVRGGERSVREVERSG